MNSLWYFIDTGELSGALNMAVDVLLSSGYYDRPCLRFYQWNPYSISLGYNQRPDFILFDKLKESNIDIVRRPTGGRAILHAEELTYSVSIPFTCGLFNENMHNLYRLINLSLNRGLEHLGIKSKLERKQNKRRFLNSRRNPACFSSSARSEIKFNGKKIVGSAQRRFKEFILQHGSILLGPFHLKIKDFLKSVPEEFDLNSKSISISEITGEKVNIKLLKDSILEGFKEILNISFEKRNDISKLVSEADKIKYKFRV